MLERAAAAADGRTSAVRSASLVDAASRSFCSRRMCCRCCCLKKRSYSSSFDRSSTSRCSAWTERANTLASLGDAARTSPPSAGAVFLPKPSRSAGGGGGDGALGGRCADAVAPKGLPNDAGFFGRVLSAGPARPRIRGSACACAQRRAGSARMAARTHGSTIACSRALLARMDL